MHIGFWSGNLRVKGRLGDLGIVGRIILKRLRQFIVQDGLGIVHRTFHDFVVLPSSGCHVECLLF
jgi:hypothetical protein